MESGGYFLFVLGERANSGTLWSSVPGRSGREEAGEEGRNGRGGTGGDKDVGERGK